jgi:uncharacterized membrane protein
MIHIILINLISLLGLAGFLLALHIHRKKLSKKKLVCPMRSNCDTVIHSDYSRIMGIPVEVLGMIYYVFIGSIYSVIFIFNLWSEITALVIFTITLCSLLFSVYLVSVQAFILKQWCAWCLLSATTSFLIFVLSYIHLIWYNI